MLIDCFLHTVASCRSFCANVGTLVGIVAGILMSAVVAMPITM